MSLVLSLCCICFFPRAEEEHFLSKSLSNISPNYTANPTENITKQTSLLTSSLDHHDYNPPMTLLQYNHTKACTQEGTEFGGSFHECQGILQVLKRVRPILSTA